MATCRGCTKKWTAQSWAHCASCHATFMAVTFFDWHRVGGLCFGDPWRGEAMWRKHLLMDYDGVWGTPEGIEERAAIAARLEKARDARKSP